jgi:hypothetical protein
MPSKCLFFAQEAASTVISQAGNAASKIQDQIGEWVKNRPILLVIAAMLSVSGCCFVSQLLARYSKMSNIELNKYYLRKRFEKQKMMVSSLTQIIKKKEDDKARGLIEERGGMADQEINESIAQSEDGQDPQVQMQFGNTASMYSDYGRGSINI